MCLFWTALCCFSASLHQKDMKVLNLGRLSDSHAQILLPSSRFTSNTTVGMCNILFWCYSTHARSDEANKGENGEITMLPSDHTSSTDVDQACLVQPWLALLQTRVTAPSRSILAWGGISPQIYFPLHRDLPGTLLNVQKDIGYRKQQTEENEGWEAVWEKEAWRKYGANDKVAGGDAVLKEGE